MGAAVEERMNQFLSGVATYPMIVSYISVRVIKMRSDEAIRGLGIWIPGGM